MCGIAGLAGVDTSTECAENAVAAMVARMRHRGPDGGGVVSHPAATLGMARLAIVDVAHGHQPMANEDGSVVLVYNGEVFNAPALRQDLERRGVRFRTRSDTEVILRLYEADPDHVEEQLVGMWAFAIHDRRRGHLVLSRDRFGIKPLFLADAGRAIAFASELRCFDRTMRPFSHLFWIDHDAAHAMITWGYVPECSTIFGGVHRLPPATRLTIDLATGRRSTRVYWELRPSTESSRVRSLDEACELVGFVLTRAVREHLESDVPLATFLSGGIDSSLVTALAQSASVEPIHAFTIGFDEPRFDESPYARAVARTVGVPLHVEVFDESTARAKLADALLAYDEPFGDSSSLATYLLAKCVGRSFKVALAGDGGDEVFAGYKKHLVARMRRPFIHAPRVRDALGSMLGRGILRGVPARNDRARGVGELLRKAQRIASALDGADADVYVRFTQFAPLARTAALMQRETGARRFERQGCDRFTRACGTELQKWIAADLSGMIGNDMLVKVDRASMARHLEVRVPFLDHRVAECGVGLPDAYTLGEPDHLGGKRVLRALHERRFGRALATRRKQGFSVPVQRWLRGPFHRACGRLFAPDRLERFGILASAELSGGGFRRWVEDDPAIAWHAFSLAAWCEAELGDGAEALREALECPHPAGAA